MRQESSRETILVERGGRVATITLNRPKGRRFFGGCGVSGAGAENHCRTDGPTRSAVGASGDTAIALPAAKSS